MDFHPSRLLIRLLDGHKSIDYLWTFLVGFLPIVLSILIGTHQKIGEYQGYLNKPNWWSLALLFPALLYSFRWSARKIIPVGEEQMPNEKPPIINLLQNESAKSRLYTQLRVWLLSPANITQALLLASIIQILDMWPAVMPYLTDTSSIPKDWKTMFLMENNSVSKVSNLLLLICAYFVQFSVTFLGILHMILMWRHNLFFVRHIYQRHATHHDDIEQYFHINIKDEDRCFGFRIANEAFNTQVKALMIAGAAMFLSRYAHADHQGAFTLWNGVFTLPRFSFPTAGQWLMPLCWLIALGIVAMPAFVKLLPLLNHRNNRMVTQSLNNYLREFYTDKTWPKNPTGQDEAIKSVASQFARNAFWPTGDNRASVLFLVSYWIFLVVLLPPISFDLLSIIITFSVYAIVAYLLKTATFMALQKALSYVDDLLVRVVPLPINDPVNPGKNSTRLFISYRRSDTAPYARSIHHYLLEHFYDDHIFMDVEDIQPGVRFAKEIENALERVDAVLVLIGREWLSVKDDQGIPRLNKPDDMVRTEVLTALRLKKRIFPVLLGGAKMPQANELPEDLRDLSEINALQISDTHWEHDLSVLTRAMVDG